MHGNMRIAQSLAPLVDLVFPPRCPSCGAGIAAQDGLCATCWAQLVLPGEPCCALCQRPFGEGEAGNGAMCAPCMADPPRHDGIAAGTLYSAESRKLVLAFKHARRIALAPMLARLINAQLPDLDGQWLVVPVPLHRFRLWKRGYNQSALLAREIARLRGQHVMVDGLIRRKHTPPLGGLGRLARARTMSGAIALNPRHAATIKGASIVLVDDVLTSGATSGACVSALKRAGAQKVVIACFARVLEEAL